MTECEYDRRHIPGDDFPSEYYRDPPHPSDTQDCRLRRIEHRREPVDTQRAEVAHSECSALEFVGR